MGDVTGGVEAGRIRIEPMSEKDAEQVCGWSYPAPYDVYRWPPWDEMLQRGFEFGDPDVRRAQYRVFRIGGAAGESAAGRLVGDDDSLANNWVLHEGTADERLAYTSGVRKDSSIDRLAATSVMHEGTADDRLTPNSGMHKDTADVRLAATSGEPAAPRYVPPVGYAQLFPLDRAVRLGIGLRPDLCDRGLGPALIRLAAAEARAARPDAAEIDLEVEQWNERAVRAYEKAGFRITDSYERRASHGLVALHCMVLVE